MGAFGLMVSGDLGPLGVEKALVAFGAFQQEVAILWSMEVLFDDLNTTGEDIFPAGEVCNPSHGIWVWEGNIVCNVSPATPDHPEEHDKEYRGSWRQPTPVEWERIMKGQNPFNDEEGVGEGSGICECGDDCPDSREPTLEERVHDLELRLESLGSSHGQLEAKVSQLEAAQDLASKGRTLEDLWDKS